jgi:hypothetical protein
VCVRCFRLAAVTRGKIGKLCSYIPICGSSLSSIRTNLHAAKFCVERQTIGWFRSSAIAILAKKRRGNFRPGDARATQSKSPNFGSCRDSPCTGRTSGLDDHLKDKIQCDAGTQAAVLPRLSNGVFSCWRRLPARSATTLNFSATNEGTSPPFSASSE